MSESGFSIGMLLLLVIAVPVIHFMVSRHFGLRAGVGQTAGVTAAAVVVGVGIVTGIDTMTAGRGNPAETTPWVIVSLVAADVLWIVLRGRARASRAIGKVAPRSEPVAARAPAMAPKPSAARVGDPDGGVEPAAGEVERAQRSGTVFLSYRRADSASTTGRISDHLFRSLGRQCVIKDVDSIPLGVDYRKYIDSMVSRCDVLIAVIGRQWIDVASEDGRRRLEDPRDLVRLEIEVALQRDIPVIPLLVDGARVPREEELPEPLRPLAFRNGIPVRPDPDFTNDMRRLIAGIEAHFGTDAGQQER